MPCAATPRRATAARPIRGSSFAPGRRDAALAWRAVPTFWEIVLALRGSGDGPQAAARLAEELSVTPDRIAVALRYEAEFPEEIEARIELHERETAHYDSLAGR